MACSQILFVKLISMYPLHCCASYLLWFIWICLLQRGYRGFLSNCFASHIRGKLKCRKCFNTFFLTLLKNCDGTCNGIPSQKEIVTGIRHNFSSKMAIVTENYDRFPSQFVTDGHQSVTFFPSVTKSPLVVEFLLPKLWPTFRHNCQLSVTISVTNGYWQK